VSRVTDVVLQIPKKSAKFIRLTVSLLLFSAMVFSLSVITLKFNPSFRAIKVNSPTKLLDHRSLPLLPFSFNLWHRDRAGQLCHVDWCRSLSSVFFTGTDEPVIQLRYVGINNYNRGEIESTLIRFSWHRYPPLIRGAPLILFLLQHRKNCSRF
jgi:hypothetical protein